MRITIELPDSLRARVMALGAHRGYRGYGRIIVEAVEHYLDALDGGEDRLREVLAMSGTWSRADAERTRSGVAEARANYRKPEQ